MIPSRDQFTVREWRLVQTLTTPLKVQRWLNRVPYNTERAGEMQQSFRSVVRTGTAHCMEAAMFAATVLEQHGYPPIVMSIESKDWLDHVVFLYREKDGWGAIGRSRDPGLHGRKPAYHSPRHVALSYVEAYVDYTGRVRAYGVVNLDDALPGYDWRFSRRNLWKVEQLLIDLPHSRIRTSDAKFRALRARYVAHRERYGDKPWRYFKGRERWAPLPGEFK